MCGCKKGKGCTLGTIAIILVIIGGINWGLVGLGMLLGIYSLNLVSLLLGFSPVLEAIVYLLVGISAFLTIFCHKNCYKNKCECVDSTVSSANPVSPESTM